MSTTLAKPAPAAGPEGATMPSRRARQWAMLAGLISVAVFLAVAELVSVVVGQAGSPLFAVGSLAIDLAPKQVKNTMVALFGTGDKAALFALMGILLVVIAALIGLAEWYRRPVGKIVLGIGGVVAILAVVTRADSGQLDAVPSVIGTIVALLVLNVLVRRLGRWQAATRVAGAVATGADPVFAPGSEPFPPLRATGVERRSFLMLAFVAGAGAVVVGAGSRAINAGKTNAVALRSLVKLPRATVTSPAVPAGASLDVAGITPYVTKNADFYRIDTALSVPSIDPDSWTLKIHGMVENPIEITWKQLLAKPLEEHMATMSCVSNDVGGDLIGNALWLGYPIRELLKEAVPKAGADMVLSRSIDGFTAGTPLSVLQDDGTDALLAIGMNGVPLPLEHGFPVRMVVPGLYGYVSATKWVTEMTVTKFSEAEGYWTPRGWDARGPAKLESRIDTPASGVSVAAGTVPIAGVAWHPHSGVKSVQVKIDGDAWVDATLADSISADTWRQWVYRWPATKGTHTIQVRAQDMDGTYQSEQYQPPAPNGAEGWDAVKVTVT